MFGKFLKRRREQRGWTQEELAERSGLAQGHISQIEKGERWPREDTIKALAAAFECEPEVLFTAPIGPAPTDTAAVA